MSVCLAIAREYAAPMIESPVLADGAVPIVRQRSRFGADPGFADDCLPEIFLARGGRRWKISSTAVATLT
jgi:hypothetical protein